MHKLEAIIFDMDGLMLDTERLAIASLKKAGQSVGINFPEALLIDLIGLNEQSANLLIEERLGRPIPRKALSEAFYEDYAKTIEIQGIPLKEGLLELLALLEQNGIRRAVATSTKTDLALKKLESVGIASRFELIVGGDKVQNGKPAPDPYLKAANELGVPVTYCLALEDSNNGAMSAYSADIPVIVIPDIKPPSYKIQEMALTICSSLHEVIHYLHAGGFLPEVEDE